CDQLLHAAEITWQHGGRVAALEHALAAYVPNDALERLGVESGARCHRLGQRDVVGRRPFAVESQHGAKDDHDRAQARAEELDLPAAVIARREHALAQLEQLAHRLLLELEPEIAQIDRDAVEGRGAVQDFVSVENVGVLHRKDVGRASPLGARQRERRVVAGIDPGARRGRGRGELRRAERVDDHEHVVIGAFGNVLTRGRGSVQHDRAQRVTVRRAELRDEFFQGHSRHGSPRSAGAAAAEATTTAEASEATAAATKSSAAPEPSATPAATSTKATDREKDRQTAATPPAAEDRKDEEENEYVERRRKAAATAAARASHWLRRGGARCGIELKIELAGVALGDARRHQRDGFAVVAPLKEWNGFIANLASVAVGDEPLGSVADLDAHVALAVGARFLRHDEDDDAGVARRIARIGFPSDLPVAADVERDIFDRTPAEIGERDDDDLAARFGVDILDDRGDRRRVGGGDDVREVVHVSDGRRNLQALERDAEQCGYAGDERAKRHARPYEIGTLRDSARRRRERRLTWSRLSRCGTPGKVPRTRINAARGSAVPQPDVWPVEERIDQPRRVLANLFGDRLGLADEIGAAEQ